MLTSFFNVLRKLIDGNLTVAARLLGVHRATLYRYLEKLGLTRDGLDRR
ncbi:MAG: hypothetical protein FDZ69_10190 [Deltaproteobacteria bacterium]|nr:MAG: hypothetical protein FDZ69_10190 [Deltaproteobacteria bacterium]